MVCNWLTYEITVTGPRCKIVLNFATGASDSDLMSKPVAHHGHFKWVHNLVRNSFQGLGDNFNRSYEHSGLFLHLHQKCSCFFNSVIMNECIVRRYFKKSLEKLFSFKDYISLDGLCFKEFSKDFLINLLLRESHIFLQYTSA